VVWTLHDCWPFTGHCSHFEYAGCDRWKTHCHHCPRKTGYPASFFLDNSFRNFDRKKELFTGLEKLTLVVPSQWLARQLKESFLKEYPVQLIYNGIDLDVFRPVPPTEESLSSLPAGKKILLGVASVWGPRKGLKDFVELSRLLPADYHIVLVGLKKSQEKGLPPNITGIERTENREQLAGLYSRSDVFVNPTWVDNFPSTNIEALACGTPVVTYRTGGSPEALDEETGRVVEKGNVPALRDAVLSMAGREKEGLSARCRVRAEKFFNRKERYLDYLDLYSRVLS
jgi:glycosyltransferase involved in cell wall biosynthesis